MFPPKLIYQAKIPQPTFLPRGELLREEEGVEHPLNQTKDIARAYAKIEPHIRVVVSFKEFFEDKRKETPRTHVNRDLRHTVKKVDVPNFDGSKRIVTYDWLQTLNTYLTFNPMTEEDALQFSILHIVGIA